MKNAFLHGDSRCDLSALKRPIENPPKEDCDSEQSWSNLWTQELAAIQREKCATYIAAGILAVLAIVAVLLPRMLG